MSSKRLEYRGDVQRGYFVAGLAGALFALPEAVEILRANSDGDNAIVAIPASDPANAYAFKFADFTQVVPLSRPRGRGALLFTRAGRIVMTSEKRSGCCVSMSANLSTQ